MIFAFFQGASVDPSVGPILNLVGGLGQSAAAVAVVWFFLKYLQSYNHTIKELSEAVRELRQGLATFCKAGTDHDIRVRK